MFIMRILTQRVLFLSFFIQPDVAINTAVQQAVPVIATHLNNKALKLIKNQKRVRNVNITMDCFIFDR